MKSNKPIVAILVFILIVSVSSCKKNTQTGRVGESALPVEAFTVKPSHVVFYDAYPATLKALNEIQLRSEVNGYITGVFFREGSHVNKGDKLFEIDRRKYQAVYEAARAEAEIAASNLEKARRDADRYQKLDEQNAIAKQVLDDGLTALENAKMQLKLAQANLKVAETDYNYSMITAPFPGIIGFSSVKPGAFVTAGQTLLADISSDNPIGADFETDQNSLGYFLRLLKSNITTNDSVFKLLLPDNSYYRFYGKLSVIDRAIDPMTGTIRIRVIFKNDNNVLRPGMNCNLMVMNENSGMHITVPVRATFDMMSENMVYLIENNKVTQRRIITGPNLGGSVIVNNGLKSGDRIVLEGLQKIHEGSVVSTEEINGIRTGAER